MTTRFQSLSSKDSRLDTYLRGQPEVGYIAIPVKRHSQDESIEIYTFEVVPEKEISRPTFFVRLWSTLGLNRVAAQFWTLLTFFIWLLPELSEVERSHVIFATLASLSLQVSVNLRNDFADHMSGRDILFGQRGNRVIQKGWFTAQQVLNWSHIWLAVAALLAVFIPTTALVFGVLFVGVFVWPIKQYVFLKKPFMKEASLVWTLGVGQYLGYSLLLSRWLPLSFLSYFCFWALLSVFDYYLSDWESLMSDDHIGKVSTGTQIGFDRVKAGALIWNLSIVTLFAVIFLSHVVEPLYFGIVIVLLSAAQMHRILRKINSPVSSKYFRARRFLFFWQTTLGIALTGSFFLYLIRLIQWGEAA